MNDKSLQDNTYWLLIQLATRARHDLARIAEKHYGLTGPQMQTLCLLEVASPMNNLSCQLACDASNVTGIADRLFAQGLIAREDNPKDRRIKMIVLTQKGRVLREQIMADLAAVQPDGMANLTVPEREQFIKLLSKSLLPPA